MIYPTKYNPQKDVIFVERDIQIDTSNVSTHPRDMLSIRAVLAHEYYGHRTFREEYLSDIENGTNTTQEWDDECRASITAAKIAPNLSQLDRALLIQDAAKRAEEFGHVFEMEDWMKGVVYGDYRTEKGIVPELPRIIYHSIESTRRTGDDREGGCVVPKVRKKTYSKNCRNVR